MQVEPATMQAMAWDDWRVFLAVQRNGTYAQAARQLGVDATTVGRRLAALESELGGRLFDRTPAGLLLTAEGQAVMGRAQRIEEEVTAAARELRGADARVAGPLRVTAPDGFVHYVLLPALSSLTMAYPGLSLELRSDTRVLDLSRREADVAVRLTRPREAALVARRAGTMTLALFASERYLRLRGAPRNTRDLGAHDFIGFEASLDHLPQVRWLRRLVSNPHYTVRANTTTAQAIACAEGHGIALLPDFVAAHEPRMAHILPRVAGPQRDLWLVTHGDLRRNTRVVAFLGWLVSLIAHRAAQAETFAPSAQS